MQDKSCLAKAVYPEHPCNAHCEMHKHKKDCRSGTRTASSGHIGSDKEA